AGGVTRSGSSLLRRESRHLLQLQRARRSGSPGGRRRAGAGAELRLRTLVLGVLLLLLLDLAQPHHVLLVLVEALGETMPAGTVGDEKEIFGARGAGGGLERRLAGIGDRPRRQAVDYVGVVAGLELDVGARDRPAERPLPADNAVDDRRVRLQLHSLLEPIDEY